MIEQSTQDFISRLQAVDGWLYDDNVYLTAAIMAAMAAAGVRGPNFEIGVYKAKYLAAIHHCAAVYAEPTLTCGVDTFAFGTTEQDCRDTWCRMFGSTDGLRTISGDSQDVRPAQILEWCDGHSPAFISIDGDHNVWPALHDHVLCADVLQRGGVIASDDFCNWSMISLMDGIARFFLTNNRHRLVPFAFCMNKLYSCHHEFHERYTRALIAWAEGNSDLPPAKRFVEMRRTLGVYAATQQELFGATCLIL
jgi:hypothetical protein